jgi:DNA-binding transcriptional MerR regulator
MTHVEVWPLCRNLAPPGPRRSSGVVVNDRRRAPNELAHGRNGAATRGRVLPKGRTVPDVVVPDGYRYTIGELEEHTGMTARTIRYYISQGLLAPAHGRGPSATYDRDHLLRLRAISRLKETNATLDEIKTRLGELSDADIAAMLEIETAPPEDRWRRIELHPDIELHVRERAGKRRDYEFERLVDKLIRLAHLELGDYEQSR